MTRKDYELIARVLETTAMARDTRERLAINMAVALRDTNPAFDPNRFIDACTRNPAY